MIHTKQCAECGKSFETRAPRQPCCSRACGHMYAGKHRKGTNNPKWKGGTQTLVCKVCSKEFTPPRSNYRNPRETCSHACGIANRKSMAGDGNPNWRGGSSTFWNKVRIGAPDECWEWQRSRDKLGYGRVTVNGKADRAYRVAYQLANGEIPQGMLVRHRCDNPPCCNPNHLLIGTSRDNFQDMVNRGRSRLGKHKDRAGFETAKAELATLIGKL